ncbi:hypothetical protein ACVWZM_005573 [Bradyrhizobium sp. USDA 4501]
MELTDLKRDFLRKLPGESLVNPPTFDHEIWRGSWSRVTWKPNHFHPEISSIASPTPGGRRLPRESQIGEPRGPSQGASVFGSRSNCRRRAGDNSGFSLMQPPADSRTIDPLCCGPMSTPPSIGAISLRPTS